MSQRQVTKSLQLRVLSGSGHETFSREMLEEVLSVFPET